MVDSQNLTHDLENVNTSFDSDLDMAKLKKELLVKFKEYQTTMKYLAADAPIEILCLPSSIEHILIDQGFLRVYDLFNVDFAEIKLMGPVRIKQLTTCLDKFFAML